MTHLGRSCQIAADMFKCSMDARFFFFQAEDGIRDYKVTGVQTCALPISNAAVSDVLPRVWRVQLNGATGQSMTFSVGANLDRKSTRLNSSHLVISYAVFCLNKTTESVPSPPAAAPLNPPGGSGAGCLDPS